ncbi:hypothetical protein TWF506_011366 [Arthrobotrys conoides]|uniref:DUF7708 domain-containing protein n=1 Tax=Arthrobotrys conoides TaxID=74498 RepID=A0AAN8PAY6_9PEZI
MSLEISSPKGRTRFADHDMAVIKDSDIEQQKFRAFVDSQEKFSEEEKSTLQIDSFDAFEKFWNKTLDSRQNFEASHEHGVGRTVRTAQNFAASAYDILQHFGPLVEVVKDLGAPYGGMAIGTISFLFAIGKNRASMESQISETLLQIRDRVAGLKVYMHIYNDNHELDQLLQSKIVETYDSFVRFCIAATKYYSMGGLRRWLKAMGRPTSLLERASEVQKAIVDVRYMSEELLNKSVHMIKQLNINQAEEIEGLKAQIKVLQEGHDGDRLFKIQTLLGLEKYSRESEIELLGKYQRNLNADFDNNWTYLERMKEHRLEAFKNHENYRTWCHSEGSCMLILAGYNDQSAYSARHCWLSPVALHMIADLDKSEQPDPYAFHILGLREPNSFPHVLLHITFQLLKLNCHALRNEAQYVELCAEIQEYQGAARNESNKTNILLQNVALRVLNMFDPDKTVWIILDRVDRCEKVSSLSHRKGLLKALAYLVENARAKVKVLAVANGYDWGVDKQVDEIKEGSCTNVVVHVDRQCMVYN